MHDDRPLVVSSELRATQFLTHTHFPLYASYDQYVIDSLVSSVLTIMHDAVLAPRIKRKTNTS